MSIILGRGHRLLHVRTLLAQRNGGEQEICPVHHGSPLDSELLHKEKATPQAPLREEPGDHEYFVANSLKEKCKKMNFLGIHDRFIRDENFRLGEAPRVKLSQPTQPIPKPIRDRSGQPEDTQGVFVVKGETSRSHEIDEKGFHEQLCVSDGSGQPEITLSVIEARNLSENKRVEQTHDGSGQPDECKEQHAPDEHREIASFNTNNEFNRAIDEEDIDFNIPGVPHCTVKQLYGASVRDLIQKVENHPNRHAPQRDPHQSQSFNPFSQETKEMIHEVGNVELCELLDMEPKAQCKVCLSYWDIGIVYCTCGHFLRNDTTENKKYIKSVLDLFSIPNFYIRKGRPHGHSYGKKEGDQEYHTANQLQKKCNKRQFLSIHDRFIRDAWFRKTMMELGRTEEAIREMDKLANEDHTHIATEEELNVYRSNWWIRSNFVGSDTMPIRHRADFKEALSTLRRLKNEEDRAYYQNWWQSSSSSWWQWQWHPSSETSPRRWT